MHGALRFFLREMVGYPARWTGLIWCCTVGALEDACSSSYAKATARQADHSALSSPFPKDRGADADVGGAFFDGDAVVAAHAHAEVGQGSIGEGGEFIAQMAQGGEPGA